MTVAPWVSPDKFKLICERRDDGGLRVSCPEIAGLLLSHIDPAEVFSALPTAINVLLTHNRPIFVFGSNLAGRHGKGAALCARKEYGAQYGVGRGRTGHAYAIPTKGERLETLPLRDIKMHVNDFLAYVREHPYLRFNVTAIGTGLAGYSHEQIAPMFIEAPTNCILPVEWLPLLGRTNPP